MTKTTSYKEFREELLADPEVRAEYEAISNEYAIASALIDARSRAQLSQQDVAGRMNTTQSAIARMESGRHAPSISSLARYAAAVGQSIRIEIHPPGSGRNP